MYRRYLEYLPFVAQNDALLAAWKRPRKHQSRLASPCQIA